MLEPATASIAIYLLAKTPLDLNKNKRLILRRPYHMKRRVCQWLLHNKHELTESVIDETSDYMIDIINIINVIKLNPSIFIIIYVFLLILVIIF